jgi:hypothetical protein
MARTYQDTLTLTIVAAASLTRYRGVTLDGNPVDEHGGFGLGICQDLDLEAGDAAGVRVLGTTLAEAGAAAAADDYAQFDDVGRVIPWEGGEICGYFLTAATTAGDIVQLMLLKGVNDSTVEFVDAPVGGATAGLACATDGTVAGAAEAILGVFTKTRAAGLKVPVKMVGKVESATSGAAVTAGAQVETDAAGKFVDLAAGIAVGVALTGTAGADESFELLRI